jgi:hypothetical protein
MIGRPNARESASPIFAVSWYRTIDLSGFRGDFGVWRLTFRRLRG